MSVLFTPIEIGNVQIKNRFVNSATEDAMANEKGEVTEALIKRYRKLAKVEIGLIISSHLTVDPLGRTRKHQAGIYSDDMISGLKKVVEAVHHEGGK